MAREKQVYKVSQLKGWMREVMVDAAKKEIATYLSTVPARSKEIKLQLARDVLAEVAAQTLGEVREEVVDFATATLVQMKDGVYSCIEEKVYKRMCDQLVEQGVLERIKRLDGLLQQISDGMTQYVAYHKSEMENLSTAMEEMGKTFNRMVREMHKMDEDIDRLWQRIENSHINV